jgi:hypothetical protein
VSPGASDLTVHRMRVRAAHPPPGAPRPPWRLRMGRLLDGADLRPLSLPPSAVLVVRSLAVAVPGELSGAGLVEPGRREAWARAAREHLDGVGRAASRPRRGRVPSGADALVFDDPAEWLACGLADGLRGGRDAWWWPPALRRSGPGPVAGAGLADVLRGEAPRVPAVLDHLVRWGWGEPLIRRLGPAGAASVLVAVRRSHRLEGGEAPETRDGGGPEPTGSGTRPAGGRGAGQHEAEGPGPAVALPAHWPRRLLPEGGTAGLAGAGRELLLLGLALHRAPSWARSPAFRAAVARQVAEGPRPGGAVGGPRRPSDRPGGPAHDPGQVPPPASGSGSPDHGHPHGPAGADTGRTGRRGDGVGGAEAPVPDGVGPRGADRPGGRGTDGRGGRAGRTSTPGDQAAGAPGEPIPGAGADEGPSAGPRPGRVAREKAPRSADVAQASSPVGEGHDPGWPTELGGVLFLLNLLEALEVEGAVQTWMTSGALGPWALLELVARGLLRGRESDRRDRLWEALAVLDGRTPGSPPGAGVSGESGVALPPTWVRELAEDAGEPSGWAWARRQGRLRVWSEAGVPVAEVEADGAHPSGATQARALLASLGAPGAGLRRRAFHRAPVDPLAGPLAAPVPAGVRPWLAHVLPFLRHRLRSALGDTPLGAVLRSPGRLFLTSSHVDLVLPLEAAGLPARRAGLDRNPGWLPRAGRVVLFHFDESPHRFA